MDRRESDPMHYTMPCRALEDEMNGIRGKRYLSLLEHAEHDRPHGRLHDRPPILSGYVSALGDIPESILVGPFPPSTRRSGRRVLWASATVAAAARLTRWCSVRAGSRKLLRLFQVLIEGDGDALVIMDGFKDQWGAGRALFHELDVPEASVEGKEAKELYEFSSLPSGTSSPRRSMPRLPHPDCRAGQRRSPRTPPRRRRALHGPHRGRPKDPLFPGVRAGDHRQEHAQRGGPQRVQVQRTHRDPAGHSLGQDPARSASHREAFEQGLNRESLRVGAAQGDRLRFLLQPDLAIPTVGRPRRMRGERGGEPAAPSCFVGPPGVGKTSLAISIAQNLGIPYHKISLGGMRDEADLRGHGFTYEGSKPGAIVQGLIKMGVMNGMFILDEADKTEKFADRHPAGDPRPGTEPPVPRQVHRDHRGHRPLQLPLHPHRQYPGDRPAARGESLRGDLHRSIQRGGEDRDRRAASDGARAGETPDRRQRRSSSTPNRKRSSSGSSSATTRTRPVCASWSGSFARLSSDPAARNPAARAAAAVAGSPGRRSRQFLDEPVRPRQINEEDRIGEMLALGVNADLGVGSVIPIQATPITWGRGLPNEANPEHPGPRDGQHRAGDGREPQGGHHRDLPLRRAPGASIWNGWMTPSPPLHGRIHPQGRALRRRRHRPGAGVASPDGSPPRRGPDRRDRHPGPDHVRGGHRAEARDRAFDAGCKTLTIPRDNLSGPGGVASLSEALRSELQVRPRHRRVARPSPALRPAVAHHPDRGRRPHRGRPRGCGRRRA